MKTATLILALVGLALLALCVPGCAHFFGHGGLPTTPPSTHHLLSNPSTDAALDYGKYLAILMMVAGVVMAAVSVYRKTSLAPGLVTAGGGFALLLTLDVYSTFRAELLIGAVILLAAGVAWWIVTHRKMLGAELTAGTAALPNLSTATRRAESILEPFVAGGAATTITASPPPAPTTK